MHLVLKLRGCTIPAEEFLVGDKDREEKTKPADSRIPAEMNSESASALPSDEGPD
tara:strand:+ start:2466 stop:2630 length:165 start_codon:yes stop_codon:yes gene_type:complete